MPFAGQKTPCSAKDAVCVLQRCGLSLVSSAPKKWHLTRWPFQKRTPQGQFRGPPTQAYTHQVWRRSVKGPRRSRGTNRQTDNCKRCSNYSMMLFIMQQYPYKTAMNKVFTIYDIWCVCDVTRNLFISRSPCILGPNNCRVVVLCIIHIHNTIVISVDTVINRCSVRCSFFFFFYRTSVAY